MFSRGCKKSRLKVGTEHEKFGFINKDLNPFVDNINEIFNYYQKYNWEKILKNFVISLKKNGASITLELGQLSCLHHLEVYLKRATK